MKWGIDAPWYNDPVERFAFNGYAMEQSLVDNVIDYINKYDCDDLNAACAAVDCPIDLANRNISYILNATGREVNYID
jgi:hypothetical protein